MKPHWSPFTYSEMLVVLLWICSAVLHAAQPAPDEVPAWCIEGILQTETHTTINTDGSFTRRDRGNDKDSRGIAQMRPIAWQDVKQYFPHNKFTDLETDPELCIEALHMYLCRYYKASTGWDGAVQSWNAGPGHKSPKYLRKVKQNAMLRQ